MSISYDDIVNGIRETLPQSLVLPNLGTNTAALMHRGELDNEFYMWGAMGMVHSMGLGVALAKPDRTVIVLDGDGALLMGLAGMSTIGALSPDNLLHIVLDNQSWGNTGGQSTHTARGVDLAQVAVGCGYAVVKRAESAPDFNDYLSDFASDTQLTMIHVPIGFEEIERPPSEPDPVGIKTRFMDACR